MSLKQRCRGRFSLPAANALRVKVDGNVHYITLPTIYSGLSKNNFSDHYGNAATDQCLGMIAEINAFSVSDDKLPVMEQTGCRQVRLFQCRGPAAAKE